MADMTNGGNQTPPGEPSMEKRLLLAFILMGAVLFLTPYVYKSIRPGPVERPAATQAAKPAPKPAENTAPAAAPEQAAPATTPSAGDVSAASEQPFIVDTDLYHIEFSNRGAVVRKWLLKKYRDTTGKPLDLVSPAGAPKTGYPFSVVFKKKLPVDVNQALFVAKPSADGLGVDYEFSSGGVSARKTFRFAKNSYLSEFSSEVSDDGRDVPHLVAWRGGFGDAGVQNAAGQQHSLFYDLASGKLVVKSAGDAKNGPVTDAGTYSFAGMEDNYFAAVFLPSHEAQTQVETMSDTVPGAVDTKEQPHVGAAVGGAGRNQFALFVGPKDLDVLRKVDPRLEQLVDFGFWSFLAKPLFVILNWTSDRLVHNYGWAIVVVTILINFVLLPMRLSGMKSMKKMQHLQPQIAQINAKYKNVGLRDPRKAEQNQEVMELYKKHGVNPLGAGCLPMLIQIPFFFAFYKVLTVAIEMRGANWLWVSDLSRPEALPIHILPVLMIGAQFFMQKMTPNPSADPNQQRMMLLMPLIFGFMFYNMSSGLVLYWLTSNLVGIVQQWFINRSMPAPAPAVAAEPAVKGRKTGSRR